MSITTFWNRIRGRRMPTAAERFPFLHSAETFRRLLNSERLRSDRNGMEFAVVQFRLTETCLDDAASSRFADALQQRLRETDDAGWFGRDGGDVAVLLWDAGVAGACCFVDAMWTLCGEDLPAFEIYIYPSDADLLDDEHGGSAKVSRPRRNCRPQVSPRHRNVFGRPPVRSGAGSGDPRPAQNLHDPLPGVKPAEVLFMQRLPVWKRALDVVGAGLGLIVLSPLLLLTAAAIKLTSRGPVLFAQQRDGHGGRPFTIYKFRTMLVGADARKAALRQQSEQDGPCFKMTHDPRITWLGRYLRKTCLDELPQLWNVLKGDMTLVGPRPLDSREARQITGFGRRRMDVTPGLTCIWQVHGKSRVSFTEWMRMDVRYIAIRSFFQDVKLIVQTAIAVLLHRASV